MKKLKKLILPVILLVLLCAVCVALFINYRESRKYQPPINGISWGMTSDEVIKKLNLSQDNVEEDENGNINLTYENATVFNQKATVYMSFDMQSQINLSSMAIDFSDVPEDELINQLKKTYGPNFGRIFNTWSNGKVKDLPQKIQDRIKYQRIDLPSKYNEPSVFSEESMWETYQNAPLVQVELIGTSLRYYSGYMAVNAIAKDDNKYNEWIEYIENLYKNRPEPASTTDSN